LRTAWNIISLTKREKVLDRIRGMQSGRLNDSRFGIRMSGEGNTAIKIAQIFRVTCGRVGLNQRPWPVSAAASRSPKPPGSQLELFDL
jgi:hypothetical protein